MAKVNKIDDNSVSIEFGGNMYVISRKEAIELAAGITAALIDGPRMPLPKKRKPRVNNARTQFEIHIDNANLALELERKLHAMGIRNAEWFSLPGLGTNYVSFITSSQRIIDKVNEALGTKFTFDFLNNGYIYYL